MLGWSIVSSESGRIYLQRVIAGDATSLGSGEVTGRFETISHCGDLVVASTDRADPRARLGGSARGGYGEPSFIRQWDRPARGIERPDRRDQKDTRHAH
ncbi:hypothetical protein ACT3SQ_14510 [Brachybacterium sp. AOP42-C2-15]|uniref:hypothetical protein n=1 Tax=unclassified Brachybacterium TaxID=2623841 RepID=UPI004034C833